MEQFSTEELRRRAAGLLALGNSPARIRTALAGMGASPDQIDDVMGMVEGSIARKQQADSRYLWWLGGVVGLLMVTLMGGAILLLEKPAAPVEESSNGTAVPGTKPPAPVQAQTLLPGLPGYLIPNQLPTDIPPDFMAATPVVIRSGAPSSSTAQAARCPDDNVEAAKLFGGDPDDWEYNLQSNGWTMTNVGAGITITVPVGMVAGYMTIVESIEMVSVDGPATVENVNFIAISCP